MQEHYVVHWNSASNTRQILAIRLQHSSWKSALHAMVHGEQSFGIICWEVHSNRSYFFRRMETFAVLGWTYRTASRLGITIHSTHTLLETYVEAPRE